MKRVPNPVIAPEVGKRLLLRCMVCDKPIEGFYARFGDQGTCNRTCMKVQDAKPKYPGHTEEEFFQRQGDSHVDAQTRGGSPLAEDGTRNQGDSPDSLLQEVRETDA